MDPLSLGLIFGGSLIGGVGNYLANSSAQDRAALAQDKAFQEWLKINIPNPKDQELALKRFVSAGELTPQMEETFKQAESEFNKIQTDPQYKAAQVRALDELEGISRAGGLRAVDKAKLNSVLGEANAQERANRMAIDDQFKRRGMGSSGFLLQSQLAANQSAADRASKQALDVGALAEQRALDALMSSGDLASKLRGQDFGEQSAKASAQDAINRFNTANMQSVAGRNIDRGNEAQKYNLGSRQDLLNMNTQLANEQQRYNKGLAQQRFNNEVAVAGGKTGQLGQQANLALQAGQNQGNAFSNLGQGLTNIGALYGSANKTKPVDSLSSSKLTMNDDDELKKYFGGLS